MSLLDLERTARQSGDVETLLTLIPEIINSTPYENKVAVLKSLIIKKNQSHAAIKSAFRILISEFLTTKTDNEKSVGFLTQLSQICEGHVFLEHERIFLATLLKNYYEESFFKDKNTESLEIALETIINVFVETFSTVKEEFVLEFMLEQLRLALICGNKIHAKNVVRKIRKSAFTGEILSFEILRIKIKYHAIMADFHCFCSEYDKASKHLLEFNLAAVEINDQDIVTEPMVDMPKENELKLEEFELARNFSKVFMQKYFMHQKIEILLQEKNLAVFFASIFTLIASENLKELIFNADNTEATRNVLRRYNSLELIDDFSDINSNTSVTYLIQQNKIFESFVFGEEIVEKLRLETLKHNIKVFGKFTKIIKIQTMSQLINEDSKYLVENLCRIIENSGLKVKIDQVSEKVEFLHESNQFGIKIENLMEKLNNAAELLN